MAITLNYYWPVVTPGSTTPAAASQQSPSMPTSTTPFNSVEVVVTGDGASTGITITHNLGLSTAELSRLFPEVRFEPQVSSYPTWWVSGRASNTVSISFSATFTVSTGIFRISRPYRPVL